MPCFMDRFGGRLSHMYLLPVRISFPLLRSSLCSCRRPISQMLGDMEPVKADLLVGMGKADLGCMNLRRPHIHLRIPCNWAGDHCGYQPIRVLFSRPSPTYSTVSALDTIVRYLWYATSSTQMLATTSSFLQAFPCTPLDPGNTLPADSQLAGNRQKTCLLGPSDHVLLKVMRVAGTCVGPGNPDRLHSMLRTLNPGNPCNQNRLVCTCIQVAPLPLRTQIIKGTYLATLRTGQRRRIGTGQRYRPSLGLIIVGVF